MHAVEKVGELFTMANGGVSITITLSNTIEFSCITHAQVI